MRIFCGASDKTFEIAELAEGLKSIRSAKPKIVTYAVNPKHTGLFGSAVTKTPLVVKPIKSMLDYRLNGIAFKDTIQDYIVETSKRL